MREKGNQLSVMPCGAGTADPLVYLSKPRFSDFVKKLGVLYERLIIDIPPVNYYSDALVIARLVVDLEEVDSLFLTEAIQRIQDAGAPLIGVVSEHTKYVKNRFARVAAATRGRLSSAKKVA